MVGQCLQIVVDPQCQQCMISAIQRARFMVIHEAFGQLRVQTHQPGFARQDALSEQGIDPVNSFLPFGKFLASTTDRLPQAKVTRLRFTRSSGATCSSKAAPGPARVGACG